MLSNEYVINVYTKSCFNVFFPPHINCHLMLYTNHLPFNVTYKIAGVTKYLLPTVGCVGN